MTSTSPSPTAARRRTGGRGRFLPRQHGAYAMLVAPFLVGCLVGGFVPLHAVLAVGWLVGYLAYQTWSVWVRAAARSRPRYLTPLILYGVITAVALAALVALAPEVLRWAPLYAVLLGVSAVCTVKGAVRSLWNDAATVAAACLVAVVAVGLARPEVAQGWMPPGAASGAAWGSASSLFAYFFGTVFYVKTMIREKGRHTWYIASVCYHGIVAVLALVLGGWALSVVALVALARAVVVPKVFPRATPKQVGLGEVALTVLVVAACVVRFVA